MEHLVVSSHERSSGSLDADTVERACKHVALNGFVVLENAIAPDLIDKVHDDWLELANYLLVHEPEKTSVGSREFRKNRIRMDIPFRQPYIDAQFVANLVRRADRRAHPRRGLPRLLLFCRRAHAGVGLPGRPRRLRAVLSRVGRCPADGRLGGEFPSCRRDGGQWTDGGVAELAPHVREGLRRQGRPAGCRASCRADQDADTAGVDPDSRDVRMWHRGTPNLSNQIRPNLALIYGRSWWDGAYYPQETLGITREAYESLSERAKHFFRLEPVAE